MLRGVFIVTVHHIVAFLQLVHELEGLRGGSLAVVIEANHVVAGGLPVASHQRGMLPEVLGEANSLDTGVFGGKLPDDLPDVVGAAVVHQHNLVFGAGARRDGVADFLHDGADGVFAAVAGDYEREPHTFSHLLLCAERAAACIIESPSSEVRMPHTYSLLKLPVSKYCPRQSAISL